MCLRSLVEAAPEGGGRKSNRSDGGENVRWFTDPPTEILSCVSIGCCQCTVTPDGGVCRPDSSVNKDEEGESAVASLLSPGSDPNLWAVSLESTPGDSVCSFSSFSEAPFCNLMRGRLCLSDGVGLSGLLGRGGGSRCHASSLFAAGCSVVTLSKRKVTVFRLDTSMGRTLCFSADDDTPFTMLLDSRFIKVSRFSSARVSLLISSDLLPGGSGGSVCLEL